MQLISITQATAQARHTLARFPLVLGAAGIAAGAAIVLVGNGGNDAPSARVLLTALLGLPLFTAVTTTGERANWNRATRNVAQGAAVLLLLAFWLVTARWADTMRITRFAHLAVAFHLLVAMLPFAGTALHRAFWQHNRLLFVRFLTAGLYAGVLFAGLALAVVAIDQLFGVDVDEEWYARLWIVMALIVHPWLFLGGVPRDLNALETFDDYPAGLKVFAQFILIPVVSVYVLILTAYLVRVLVTRTWPSGWIGYLVSSVSAAGTLALLLVHPVRQRADSRWVDAYGRWFYVALLPSIAMLLMAIWLRVDQYGFTENRYFLAGLALWLAGIALFYGVTASRNIRVIPTTLAVVALVTFVGPWSAYAVSRRSQVGRLRDLLVRNEILVGSQLNRSTRSVPFAQRSEMSSVLRYLLDMHGARSLGDISAELRQVAESPPPPPSSARPMDDPKARAVMERLGVAYVRRSEQAPSDQVTYFAEAGPEPIRVEGYEWMTRTNLVTPFSIPLGSDTVSFTVDSQPARSVASLRGQRLLEIPLWPLLDQARQARQSSDLPVPAAQLPPRRVPLILDGEGGGLRLRFHVHGVTGRGSGSGSQVSSADATILLNLTRR